MVTPVAQLRHDGARARIDVARFGARFTRGGEACSESLAVDLAGGLHRLAGGDLELRVEVEEHGNAATLRGRLRNRGAAPLRVEGVEFGFVFGGHGHENLRFLRHGWQSWSPTGIRSLDGPGDEPFPSGPWLRGMYHCLGEPKPGWHESESLALVGGLGGGPFCLVGVLEKGGGFGVVRLAAGPGGSPGRPVAVEVELVLEVELEPGEQRELEVVRVALGHEANPLLERFAELWGTAADARRGAAFQAGWCSWYHFFHRVSEDDLLRNLDALAADRSAIPVEVVQLDDGFQPAMGDWLRPSPRFPSGLAQLAGRIRDAGFRPGIWTAPFAASAESEVLSRHPDWTLRHGDLPLRGSYNPEWSEDGWVYVLDPSQPAVLDHLTSTFAALVEMGFEYLKLDFLYMPAMLGRAADASLTRAQRLRVGLEAIRRGAGDAAFLLGCGCPFGPAVGIVDGMRIGPDVAPSWGVDQPVVIPGLEEMLPSTRTALRSIFARQFLHRRVWLNDPDCLMVRGRDTALSVDEAGSLATAIALSGGMVVFSDDVPLLEPGERAAIGRVAELASRVDAGASRGTTRVAWPQESDGAPCLLEARVGSDLWLGAVNLADASARVDSLSGSALASPGVSRDFLHGEPPSPEEEGTGGTPTLRPHASAVIRAPGAHSLAVFCDFDGTFAQCDIGSTLARQHLPELRAALQKRYEAGELGAWEYAVELFDGFGFAPDRLDVFLGGIELDPGARSLLAFCKHWEIPFRILSDGFDYNIERIRLAHDLGFAYSANRLVFEAGRWRISPGGLNPDCDCATGTCKRAIIEGYRRDHPGAWCVHIGDGRVSDLCGAEAADMVFAKGSLVESLRVRGIYFEPFSDLGDVSTFLEKSLEQGQGPSGQAPRAPGDFRR